MALHVLPVGSPTWIPQLLRAVWPFGMCPKYLLGKPDAAGLCHPLAGVDPGVDPDGRAVRAPCAELGEQRGGVGFVLVTLFPSGSGSPNPHLEHVEGTVLGRAADLQLAHQVGVLSHQQVQETVDLGMRDVEVTPSSLSPAKSKLFPPKCLKFRAFPPHQWCGRPRS